MNSWKWIEQRLSNAEAKVIDAAAEVKQLKAIIEAEIE